MDRIEVIKNDLEIQQKRLAALRAAGDLPNLTRFQEAYVAELEAELQKLSAAQE